MLFTHWESTRVQIWEIQLIDVYYKKFPSFKKPWIEIFHEN